MGVDRSDLSRDRDRIPRHRGGRIRERVGDLVATAMNPYHQADHGEEVWMVDETPTKHWVTIVFIPNKAVSAECRCGWVMEADEERSIFAQRDQASAAARRHREDSIVTHQDAPGGGSMGPPRPEGPE